MIRKITLTASLFLVALYASAQIYDPVSWDFSYEQKGKNQFELIFTASIEENSHIYSMDIPDGGPIPTSFRFDSLPGVELDGKTYEVTRPAEMFDEAFGLKIKTFSNKAEFRQKINTSGESFTVSGAVNFMACNNATCSPPKDVDFTISNADKSARIAPVTEKSRSDQPASGRGLLKFFLISLLAGFAGVLTPCVFPMIPMTVAFFSRGSENRSKAVFKALVFGISIVLIYSSLGIIVSLTSAGAGFANTLSTHWIPNLLFFILFIVFAISFFGAFEIILPNKWVTSADSKVDKGGVLASFFMGLTTVIVSFSCTGPIIGALLVEAASGDVLRPTFGMVGFGVAFALPFTVFALFPSFMNRMPKSGGWLNSIKVVLGFIMLAFSMKFLMTIDSVYSLGILSRDLFLSVWIVLFSLLGFYLMGKLRFIHDSDVQHIGTFRLFLIIVVFSFVVYLIPGLFGSPLKGLSSFLPSSTTTELNLPKLFSENRSYPGPAINTSNTSILCSEAKHDDIFDMPLGLKGYFDYKQGLACAKEQGKPVLIDFKGHACANCKLMEAKVWSDPEVLERLRDNFVIIALYVDDRTQLPENEWITSTLDGKQKKTIGKQNEDLEISKFETNALPLYVITDHEGNPLNKPMPSNLNVEEYKRWLDEGVKLFESNNSK
ncbi:MAG TPA: cytochrome c biogenesis protein CcdA [Bacteroidales bacterium]|nr:cytochrome c biogenesis protein CcdA [Bacteroidales bacterium]HPT21670.1 cytochrome c biogenesis protein CcdA [Bacteroidales bacterium]